MGRLLMHNCKTLILTFVMLAGLGGTAVAQAPDWVEQGPGPILNGGEGGISAGPGQPNPVAGARNVLRSRPTSAGTHFVGSARGGSWATSNAPDDLQTRPHRKAQR